MFIPNDGNTEIIAHFIGYFQICIEEVRYRPDFDPFANIATQSPEPGTLDARSFQFRESFELSISSPKLSYVPSGYTIVTGQVEHSVSFDQLSVSIPRHELPARPSQTQPDSGPTLMQQELIIMPEPGSTILIASQYKYLSDDDVLVVGDIDFIGELRTEAHAELEALSHHALSVSSGLAELADLRSVAQVVELVDQAPSLVQKLSAEDFQGFDKFEVKLGDTLDGFYSNGVSVEKQVTMADSLPLVQDLPDMKEADQGDFASIFIDAAEAPTTMSISSGGNISWNDTTIVSAGLAPAVFSVAGDYHRFDAIYQTNVLRDIDTVDDNWPAQNLTMGGNTLQNSAGFVNQDYASYSGTESPANGMPENWSVTSINGDMIFLDWVQQYNFTLDNDTQILTAMGTNTFISTGLNIGFNDLSFANLGQYFDLVLIGGSLYDGNFIVQTNVLLDSDNLSVLDNSSAYLGDAATGENLLWNQATIQNIGTTNWQQGLPGHYQSALDNLAQGNKAMPSGFTNDSVLDGLGNLKVLYISGNVYDIHYIDQINIVGDADDLAIYEASLLEAQESVWKVSTGHNMLANKATILDYDSLGEVAYVGGQIYSDAVLVQADLLEGLDDRTTTRGDEIANEVLAFLDDHTDLSPRLESHPAIKSMADYGISSDMFQSMFA
ncbi:hypothetical protein [Chelativorans sp. Marseille-P2723]|uniref:hypothetical protein n=1 Tax=Chelativorans sp. Marseille-P2723 TaxID=2709133 RepID=UPI0015702AFF|nr:hypothetical protein [Chelativorans sp. Marseille-P2723]